MWWPSPPEHDDDRELPDVPHLEVEDTPNPVVATLLGPDGEVLSRIYERPRRRVGYRPGDEEPSRVERLT